ncbi:MAG: cupin domain-containing protein [Chloroflexota bacterium]
MKLQATGRRLDTNGYPIDGTGFDYAPDSRLAELMQQRNSPIISQPQTGEWIFGLVAAEETGGEFASGVVIFRPGNAGPPEHIHPTYDEHFDILAGEFVFTVDSVEQVARPGDTLVVKQGVAHTFRCVSDEFGALIGETRPASRTAEVISTLFGMAHEGKLSAQGQPQLLHAMVIGAEFADDTVFTSPPPAITLPLARMLAPVGRLFGYQATYEQYRDEAFWLAHVEQPVDG